MPITRNVKKFEVTESYVKPIIEEYDGILEKEPVINVDKLVALPKRKSYQKVSYFELDKNDDIGEHDGILEKEPVMDVNESLDQESCSQSTGDSDRLSNESEDTSISLETELVSDKLDNSAPSNAWVFTINNYTQKQLDLLIRLKDNKEETYEKKDVHYMVFQKELAPTTGTPHLQGYVKFGKNRKHRKSAMFKIFNYGLPMNKKLGDKLFYLAPAKGDPQSQKTYCSKVESKDPSSDGFYETEGGLSVAGIGRGSRTDIYQYHQDLKNPSFDIEMIKDKHPGFYYSNAQTAERQFALYHPVMGVKPDIKLFPYQIKLNEEINTPWMKRRCFWLWSKGSNTGKSTSFDYFSAIYKTLPVIEFKFRDIMYAYDKHQLIWVNIPRKRKVDDEIITLLELLTDGGLKPSDKYASTQKYVNSHIIVTANVPPVEDDMPQRYVEYHLLQNGEYERIDHMSKDYQEKYTLELIRKEKEADEFYKQSNNIPPSKK